MKSPIDQAKARYKNFHGRPVKKVAHVSIEYPKALVYLGEAFAVEYKSDKKMHRGDTITKKRHYRHKFGNKVKAYTDPKGKVLFILGGRFKVTDWLRN